ncbi:hypothetical protein MKW98_020952 [Papaver atlanticum]|uniref:Uncharacterized protein n=1 Tax=Papaver atlanticum TaxID=357466 RepID=A0AAD4XU77_9MAGN|nr:hypothetical protein MKW98_020952 [Papaver atlanticum]
MGNCVCSGFGNAAQVIKVITSNGGIMEFYTPITAECITNEFPGHGIYKTSNGTYFLSNPVLHKEELFPGELYYLLPLNTGKVDITTAKDDYDGTSSSFFTPYRMSFDQQSNYYQGSLKRSDSETTIRSYSSNSNSGVWKVKLVINPEQLSKILSKETSTEALVNSVRTVAKFGCKGVPPDSSTPSVASSGIWSLSGSCKASSSESFA